MGDFAFGLHMAVDTFGEYQYWLEDGGKHLYRSDKRYGALILTDKHASFQDHLLSLLDLSGKVPDDIDALLLIPYKKRSIAQDLEIFYEGFPNSRVLWDQSGTAKDSIIGKNEIEVGKVPSRVDGKSVYIAIPKFESCELSGVANLHVKSLVQKGLEEYVRDAMRPASSDTYVLLSKEEIGEIVSGITFGHCHAHADENVDAMSCRDGYFHTAVELVLGGYADVGEDFVELAKCASVFQDCFYIWTQTMRNLGCPVVFAPAHVAGGRNIAASGIETLGEGLGIDSMIDAYFAGVPINDILA